MAGAINRRCLVAVAILCSCAALAVGNTPPVLRIAGSGTVYPVAVKWAQEMGANYTIVDNSGKYTVCAKNHTICEGGSGAGIKRACAARSDRTHVHIGTASRDFQSSEALRLDDGYTFECSESKIRLTQVVIGIDGLAVVTAAKGAAASCLLSLGGLTIAQVRWIFTGWNNTMLTTDKDGGVDLASAVPNDNHNGVKEWSDLSAECAQIPINPYGPGPSSGTGAFFGEQVFCKDCFGKKPGRTPENFPYCDNSQNTVLEDLSTIDNITDFITDTNRRKMNCYHSTSDDNYDKVSQWVSADNAGVAFLGIAFYVQNSATLAVVRIASDRVKGVQDTQDALITPSAYSIIDGSYSVLTRPLFMNVDNEAFPLVRDYLLFGFSEAGMALVAQVGYIRINSALRAQMYQRAKHLGNPTADYVPVPPSKCWNGTRMAETPYINAFGKPKVEYTCEACQLGRAKADNLPIDCRACDGGSFAARDGQSKCELCEQGSAAAAGASSCMPCSVGQYARYTGSSSCSNCPAGFYSQAAGASSCAACPFGTYSEEDGASQCTLCSSPGSAMQLDAARTLTTRYLGASTAEACACPEGFYRDEIERDTCKNCPAGMSCDFGSDWRNVGTEYGPRPVAKPGFMTTASRPHGVYKCLPAGSCPGGPPGSCAPYRDGAVVACGHCEQGAYSTGTSCTKCDTRVGALPVIVTVVLAALTLAIVVYSVNKNRIRQTHGSINIVVGIGLIAALLQMLGMFGNLSVRWPTFTDDLLNALKFVNFDLGILRLSCVMPRGPVLSFLYPQLLAPFAAFIIGLVLFFKKMRRTSTRFAAEFGNSLGTVLNTFFVGVLLSTMKPLMCYDHPSGESSSLINQPSVLCNYASEHRSMVVLGMMSCTLVPLPFVSMVLYSTLRYKTLIVQQAGSIMLLSTRWLFFKYEPSRYYYGSVLLTKNILVCFVPVVIRDRARGQVLMLTAVLVLFGMVQAGLWPWRSTLSNFIDAFMSLFLILLVQCADSRTVDDGFDVALQALALLFIVSLLVVGLLSFAFNVVQNMLVRPFYKWFICHHKAHAGAQARFMKMLLDSKSPKQGGDTFLDSDHLKDLDRLFDLVKSHVGCLVVYLTSDTLRRLWCCGEISTAYSLKVKVVRVVTDKFTPPTQEQLKNLDTYVDFSGGTLDQYGIDANTIKFSLTWIIGDDVPAVKMQTGATGEDRLTQLVCGLLDQARSTVLAVSPSLGTAVKKQTGAIGVVRLTQLVRGLLAQARLPTQPTLMRSNFVVTDSPAPGTVVFSADPFDDEAIAAAGIVRLMISSDVYNEFGYTVQCLHDHDSENIAESYGQIILASSACIVFMASGMLTCWEQLYTIVQAIDTFPDGAVVSVTLPDFKFPTEIFYLQNSQNVITGDLNLIRERFRSFFRLIAVPLSTSASRQILSTQACEVCVRITSVMNAKVGQRGRKPARELTSCDRVRPLTPPPRAQVANTFDDVEVDDIVDV